MKNQTALSPLRGEARATLPNVEAAAHLGLQPQTLRGWACHQSGPIRPVKVGSRLHWRTADLRRVLGDA